ncbi:MAG: exo-alpha-sialidase [Candidatus Hydrogenedentes bacterium]|nr:exo-alpha-sialidase [Candidatus Hydrogenedentota bacterium]
MRIIIALLAGGSALLGSAWAETASETPRDVVVYKEAGRFAGWPANNGAWSWGNEIVVGFSLGYYKLNPQGGHAIDRDRPSSVRQARSLDGGETWAIETPDYLDDKDNEREPIEMRKGIDFSKPDLAVRFRDDRVFYSLDRGKTWQGPYMLPAFGRKGLLARTDYIVEDKRTLTAFIAATKDNGKEGQPLCIRTTDGGKNWNVAGWIGKQPPEAYGYAIMPSTVRLDSGAYLSVIRRAGVFDGERRWWLEAFLSPDKGRSWYLLAEPNIVTGGNPASMIKLKDGRIALTYGWRIDPCGIRARISTDDGQTWGQEIILRHDGASWDLGYPRTVQRADGKCVTIYYYHHANQPERYISATIWDPGRN